MEQTTTKRVKVVGTEEYINTRTGELEQMQVTSIEDRDFNFTKMWMKNFISTLDIVGNQKTRLCFWIIDHVDKENRLIGTYRTIASQSGMSLGNFPPWCRPGRMAPTGAPPCARRGWAAIPAWGCLPPAARSGPMRWGFPA